MKPKLIDSLSFLFPSRVIKSKHFTKKDVKHIKENLTLSFADIYMISSLVMLVLVSVLLIFQSTKTNNRFIEVYGMASFIGHIFMIFGCITSFVLLLISKTFSNVKRKLLVTRIAGNILYISSASYMFACFFADAQLGFVSSTKALSPSIIFIAILLLIQQMNWTDAIILDASTSIALIILTAYCRKVFNLQAAHYYGIISIIYPLACYMVVSLLFFAESQKYKETLENERLHNHAYYDSLTHCKNRHYLEEFILENAPRWENKDNANVLMIMFDIDDFKLYNSQFSHLGGDYCLKSLSDAVRRQFASPDLDFFRYGGEEFLLFFEASNYDEAVDILHRVKESVSTLNVAAPKGAVKDHVTISIGGLYLKNIKHFDFEEEMKKVDGYMYQSKEAGKDSICCNGVIID